MTAEIVQTTAPLTLTTPVKFLREDGTGPYSGFAWPLPVGDEPGAWVEVAGELVACEVGFHHTTPAHWRVWRNARLFVIETDGPVLHADTKWVSGRARLTREIAAWNPTTLRLFAADCAERVLHLFEVRYPGDERPRAAIEVARRHTQGKATADELRRAYHAASAASAPSAAAAYAASAAYAAAAAAAAAADAADAAYAAAAERQWQNQNLLHALNGGR